jgi:hypothetical protein
MRNAVGVFQLRSAYGMPAHAMTSSNTSHSSTGEAGINLQSETINGSPTASHCRCSPFKVSRNPLNHCFMPLVSAALVDWQHGVLGAYPLNANL